MLGIGLGQLGSLPMCNSYPATVRTTVTYTFSPAKIRRMTHQELKQDGKFRYIESPGNGPVLMLLHGLFGALSNFQGILSGFGESYKVVVPMLPIYDLPLRNTGIGGLRDYVAEFVKRRKYERLNLLGNSLGGHIAQIYTLDHPEQVNSITLTGSSGLFESAMGTGFPKRGDRQYIEKKVGDVFYDPATATEELIDEVFDITTDREKALRVVMTAKSAVRHNLTNKLEQLKQPVLLVWGKQDEVTPPFVAEKYLELLPNARLHWVDRCGHAPMMEHPEEFNRLLTAFLAEVNAVDA